MSDDIKAGECLKNINELVKAMERNLIGIGIEYIKKHNLLSFRINRDDKLFRYCIELRDSVLYKIRCINFHLKYLVWLDQNLSSKLKNDQFNDKKRMDLLIYGGDQQLFLLDDIVFHIVSLLDYLGNLIGFYFYGESKKEIKWKWIKRCCNHPDSELKETGAKQIGDSSFCPIIKKYQERLWDALEGYRGRQIHIGKDSTERKAVINIMRPAESLIKVEIPKRLQKVIAKAALLSEGQETKLKTAATCIVEESYRGITDILNEIYVPKSK